MKRTGVATNEQSAPSDERAQLRQVEVAEVHHPEGPLRTQFGASRARNPIGGLLVGGARAEDDPP